MKPLNEKLVIGGIEFRRNCRSSFFLDCLCVYVCVRLSVHFFVPSSVYLCLWAFSCSVCLSLFFCESFSVSVTMSPSVSLSLHVSVSVSVYAWFHSFLVMGCQVHLR